MKIAGCKSQVTNLKLQVAVGENSITIPFQARYYTNDVGADAKQVWFALHGYGQLAQYFIRKFDVLAEHQIKVVAPEALSRFYLEPLTGAGRKNNRVGATWMTKEDRETDIRNYLTFLDTVFEKEVADPGKSKVTILGFSQGSATASRWAMSKNIYFNRLILWAGVFPPDMDFILGKEILKDKKVQLVHGKSDPFLTDSRMLESKTLIDKLGVGVEEVTFDGGHDLDPKTLSLLAS